ncbi:MAG: methyltransferase domain-containing protein [Rhodothermales bacterium]|nr:methyltransferase domain-containing protein [Rhodothermales bacterium]
MIYPRRSQDVEDVGRHYDALDEFYREVWGDHVHHGLWLSGDESNDVAVRNLVSYATRHTTLPPGTTVCDVGCGYGAVANLLAGEHGAVVTGLTVSERQYDYALREYGSPQCEFLLRDWMRNELDDSSFDVVLAIESLSHMPDKSRFFSETFRVLRPGGTLVVAAWLAGPSVGRLQRRHLLQAICSDGRLPSMANAGEAREMARTAGFDEIVVENVTGRVRRTWWICQRRLVARILTDRRYQRYLLDAASSDRKFLLTIFRILAAYRTGAMQYGLFSFAKPPASS